MRLVNREPGAGARLLLDQRLAKAGIRARQVRGMTERYDLAIPTSYLKSHRGLSRFLDTLVSRGVRAEIQALGGYDTRDAGRRVDWRRRR